MKKFLTLIIAAVFLFSLFSCSDPSLSGKDECYLILSKDILRFKDVGEAAALSATVIESGVKIDSSLTADSVSWSSSNDNVAVCDGGSVRAVGYGACVIQAKYKGATAFCVVSNPNPNPTLSITSTEILFDNIGKKQMLMAISENGEDISSIVTWTSSNKDIAVCKDGIVTAIGYGSCIITARMQSRTAVCAITVNDPTAPGIELLDKEIALDVGGLHSLDVVKKNGADDKIVWKSSNPSIATCDNGVVTAHKKGVCVILAMTDKGHTAYTVVNVGDTKPNLTHEKYLKFDFPHIGKELLYVDSKSGRVISKAVVVSYRMTNQLLSDGRLVVEITLNCVKTFDSSGPAGRNAVAVSTELYREKDVFCDKKQYIVPEHLVGDTFSVKCSGFTVQTKTDGTQREFYMVFSSITES